MISVKLRLSLDVVKPIVLTNFSGHIVNAIVKRVLGVDDPARYFVSITPFLRQDRDEYLLSSPTPLERGVYRFAVAFPASRSDVALKFVQAASLEIEGVPTRVSEVALSGVDVEQLRRPPYPSSFMLEFLTPTHFGRRVPSRIVGKSLHELLPTPNYVFGSLAAVWNGLVDKDLKVDIREYVKWVKAWVHVSPPFKVWSWTVRLGGRREIPGFMGHASFSVFDEKSENHVFTVMLARLAEYVGVGSRRRLGMGVTAYHEAEAAKRPL
ncbi:MAG: CRISPR system precrRNA processing endoribonuclease RAMP protein Cas6 [Nitrososphaerota archaeon]